MVETDLACVNKAMEIKTKYDCYWVGRPDKDMVRNIASTIRLNFGSGRILTLEKGKILQIQIVPMINGKRFWESPEKVKSISVEED